MKFLGPKGARKVAALLADAGTSSPKRSVRRAPPVLTRHAPWSVRPIGTDAVRVEGGTVMDQPPGGAAYHPGRDFEDITEACSVYARYWLGGPATDDPPGWEVVDGTVLQIGDLNDAAGAGWMVIEIAAIAYASGVKAITQKINGVIPNPDPFFPGMTVPWHIDDDFWGGAGWYLVTRPAANTLLGHGTAETTGQIDDGTGDAYPITYYDLYRHY